MLVLGGTEAALRLAGYGYPTGLFQKMRIGQEDFLVENEKFSLRFFPPELVRFPEPFRLPVKKSPDTCRIFILGESAATGDPEAAYGAGRYLAVLLRERFPGQTFEILNLGITAIDSHVILPIARECARQHGDIWIIYMGNNEFVGPFGAAGVLGPRRAPPLALIRLGLALQQTRLGQALTTLTRRLQGRGTQPAIWSGMEMFAQSRVPPADPIRAVIQHHFERNLEDIVQAGLDSGAKIILNTVAVNLRDCPPFASCTNASAPEGDRARFSRLYAAALEAQSHANYAAAASNFEAAATLEPQFAELQFRWAESLFQLNNFTAARQHFQLACDLDALPFRADSAINGAIRSLGGKGAPGLVLLDAAAVLATNNPAGVSGGESFYEHVHLNFDGNYRLGRAWAEQVERQLPPKITSRATARWSPQALCEQRLGLTDWNRCFTVQHIKSRFEQAPLNGQLNAALRLESALALVRELQSRMTIAAITPARELYAQAIQRFPTDYYPHKNYAYFLEAIHDASGARAEWQHVHELIPQFYLADFEIGRLLVHDGQWSQAKRPLAEALELRPTLAEGWFELGRCHAAEDNFELARKALNRACFLSPRDPAFHTFRGRVLAKLDRHAEARDAFRTAILSEPRHWDAHRALADEYLIQGMLPEAKSEYEAALRLKPDLAGVHLNLGIALAKLGQMDDAKQHFSDALRLEPDNREARQSLERLERSHPLQP
jgi:tetratricopeptide (TPR) repeat protein